MTPTLLADALKERYALERELGRGGMAVVWLAMDLRHHRRVAIKVLHPELSAVLGSDRFLHEIQLTASLQHPHILPLYDSGEAGELLYYVMPYVAGETLRRRLQRERQLPVTDAVRIGIEVADALAYAHRRDVVHRDIKPENILLQDGHALVADFGIALAVQHAGGERMTQTGLSLGTPQYMAPEQAAGQRELDHRVDIFALGVVVYEMLAGDPPFSGATAQAIVARVLTEDPFPLTTRRRSVPEHVEAAVLTALEKVPGDRFGSAAEFAAALGSDVPRAAEVRRRRAPKRRQQGLLLIALALALLLGAAAGLVALRGGAHAAPARALWIEMVPPPGLAELAGVDVSLSPDGSRYLFSRGQLGDPAQRLVVRGFADTAESVLDGTAGADAAIWSPDGRSIAFLRGRPIGPRTLVILPLDGGPAVELTDSATQLGAWLPSDTVVYTWLGSVMAVSTKGGTPRQVRAADAGETLPQFRTPAALPGRSVLVVVTAPSLAEWRIGVLSLDGGELRILGAGVSALYLSSGHVLLAQADGRVLAARFDPVKGRLTTATRPVLTGLDTRISGFAELSVADNGTLVYQAGGGGGLLVTVGRDGTERLLSEEVRNFNDVAVSPDGRLVATGIDGTLWTFDVRRRTLNRLTQDPGDTPSGVALFPVWSPDGRSVAYSAAGDTCFVIRHDGGKPSLLFTNLGLRGGAAWSPDGRSMLISAGDGDLRIVDLGSGRVGDFAASRFIEQSPSFSPYGQWVAYTSDESGHPEVYVQRFPAGGSRSRISVEGGTEPAWSTGGSEIFFRSPRGFMTASISLEDQVAVRKVTRLFDDRDYQKSLRHREYAVLPGDSAFVFIRGADVDRLFLRVRWTGELDSLLPDR